MPLTTEGLIKTIENNQSTSMFYSRGDITEDIIHNRTGQLARFGKALSKYPPVYWDKYDVDLYELLTKHQITFVTTDKGYATKFVKTIEAPKCTDLFMTVIDGIHIYVL